MEVEPGAPQFPAKEVQTLQGHAGAVLTVKYNTDGNYCMTGGADKTVRLWNPSKGMCIKSYKGHGWEVMDIAIAKDNSRFATCGGDRQPFLWDVSTGRIIRKFKGHDSRINCIAFNAECTVVATGSYDKTVKLWDVKSNSNEPIQVLEEAKDSISDIKVTATEIISASIDGVCRRYDIRLGMLTSDTVGKPVTSVHVTHDEHCFLLTCLDATVRLIDKTSGELLNEYIGHKNVNYKITSLLTRDDAYVMSGSEDGIVYIWEMVDAKLIHKLKGHTREVCALDLHPSENALLTASGDGSVKVWR